MQVLKKVVRSLCKKQHLKTKATISKKELQSIEAKLSTSTDSPPNSGVPESELIKVIKEETKKYNLNNIIRTKAYLDYFLEHPEIHWSFLAHMVSRNGGWNMTDLKGSLISPLISSEKAVIFFEFLEKANALIFHDAYPQLLLYHHSKKRKKNLFHLLPYFSVSSFMKPIWDYFWETQNSSLLTVGLIINEQNYIQQRLIESELYQAEVLNTALFNAQEKLGFTDVFFPYRLKKLELAGVTVQDFNDVFVRIETGKKLYGILFFKIFEHAYKFATSTPHTGSRADFWPNVFTVKPNEKELFYSPTLEEAWSNYDHSFKLEPDWFTSSDMIKQLKEFYIPKNYKLTKNYKSDLERLDLLSDIKKVIT
ncbi:hypothetical protein JOC85_002692 [Bacillus mesophilus]|uniref:DUF2515 domain-containing protein n=1 Tax=Bacillus mesophilus TaxID=1808955 RepID=A0A6M0Q8Z3_9BACI|nr:DUF2515 family protein [Bacillus mesophilus]MBM7661885.1 hypothetical protein [Bacillus mesophilus]NEY72753.1 DUF2515 domain-containing protein [Bacillus mesophilus]